MRKNEGINEKTSAKGKVGMIIVALVLVVTIVTGTITGLLFKKNSSGGSFDSNYVSLDGSFSSRKVTDNKSAIEAIVDASAFLNLSNAKEEIKRKETVTIGNDKYYRYQQVYQGIPVYGRQITLAVNENNQVSDLVANTVMIPDNMDLTFSLKEEDLTAAVSDSLDDAKVMLMDSSKIIYSFDTDPFTAFDVRVSTSEGVKRVFLNAATGNVIDSYLEQSQLEDNRYSPVTLETTSKIEFHGSYDTKEKCYEFVDPETRISIYDYQGNDSAEGINNEVLYTSSNKVFGDTELEKNYDMDKAIAAYHMVAKIQEWYKKQLNEPLDNIEEFRIGINDANSSGNNAYAAGPMGDEHIAVINLGQNLDYSNDKLCHEFSHLVQNKYIEHYDKGETGAIREAYSDIMGELYAETQDGSTDWVQEWATTRNIREPSKSNPKCPEKYKGRYYKTVKDYNEENDNGYVHRNSTVLSHAAYLMWNGIDGKEEAKLSSEQILNIWYRSLVYLSPRPDFMECANDVLKAARNNEDLTDEQVECVKEAFEKVGLEQFVDMRSVLRGEKFDVYDSGAKPIEHYHLKVKDLFGNRTVLNQDIDAPYFVDLEPGTYRFEITADRHDYSETILVKPNLRQRTTKSDYSSVFAAYKKAYQNGFTDVDEQLVNDQNLWGGNEESELARRMRMEDSNTLHYAYKDMNNDGIDELFIGFFADGENETIVDCFTYDGNPVRYVPEEYWYNYVDGASCVFENGDIVFYSQQQWIPEDENEPGGEFLIFRGTDKAEPAKSTRYLADCDSGETKNHFTKEDSSGNKKTISRDDFKKIESKYLVGLGYMEGKYAKAGYLSPVELEWKDFDDINISDAKSVDSNFNSSGGLSLYSDFLINEGYKQLDWNIYEVFPSQYALLDIDQDGKVELIVSGKQGNYSQFYSFAVFGYDTTTKSVYVYSFDEDAEDNQQLGQYYNVLAYSNKYQSLAYTPTRDGWNYYGLYDSVTAERTIRTDFYVYRENQEQPQYGLYDNDSGSEVEISEETYWEYQNEKTTVEWKNLNEVKTEILTNQT